VTRPDARRGSVPLLLGLLLLAVAFGVLMALVKGTGAGIRYEVGNMSAPWLIVPVLLGRTARGHLAATLLGGLAALFSLLAFYATAAVALGLVSSSATIGNNLFFVIAGTIGGAAFGLFASLWREGAVLLPLVFLAEPLVILVFDKVNATPWTQSVLLARLGEAVVGLAWLAAVTIGSWRSSNTR
jgi:hypothetical protein